MQSNAKFQLAYEQVQNQVSRQRPKRYDVRSILSIYYERSDRHRAMMDSKEAKLHAERNWNVYKSPQEYQQDEWPRWDTFAQRLLPRRLSSPARQPHQGPGRRSWKLCGDNEGTDMLEH